MASTDLNESREFFRQMLLSVAALGVVPFGLLLFFGPQLFSLVFGGSWREAGVYASILALPHFVGFIAGPVMPTLTVLERQGWQLGWDGGRLALATGSVWLAGRVSGDAKVAVAAYGGAIFVSYAAHSILSYVALRRATMIPRPIPRSAA
jgi:O-antigen/teichoic acid export membrane protein